ncbi:hypothetical protein METBIDRAFT_38811 [Metschnikowia bicuspidata var. bicuspidata NRRL YB-4993]|uniref:WD40 repeat-like protein n=1 Tax=Metschnikowia bicuspidata var. bicuspidata NRRL YB-4993 TaxID=869754 RepID=A0A1A0HEJ1_9ASCO|nr:hypothetical protein METBIDRAFT_38811 [Metschnikowia bicuspidata var. bicuspidata NRRL YB-4993]OBA22411.1 hypothetical protein METBIDRAFT_38811 [Metschnikowia bicuspidata var. bicuspidata NRRL YB-4993]
MNDLSFNQDVTSLLVSTAEHLRIFNCDPFGEFYVLPRGSADRGPQPPAGAALARMLFLTSLTIIVPQTSGTNSGAENDRRVLQIHNLKQHAKICELAFPLPIRDVRLNRRRLVVFVDAGQIYIYDLGSVRLVKVLEVGAFVPAQDAPGGRPVVAALSPDDASLLVLPLQAITEHTDLLNSQPAGADLGACLPTDPELLSGGPAASMPLGPWVELTHKNEQARLAKNPLQSLADLRQDLGGWVVVYDTVGLQPRLVYKAHDSPVTRIAISSGSKYIATASAKGTILRVAHIHAEAGQGPAARLLLPQVTNLRRGHHSARINALAFSLDLAVLGCASESGTVHLFSMRCAHPALTTPPEPGASLDTSADIGDGPGDEHSARLSSLEDLNENLANLLLLKEPEAQRARRKRSKDQSYLSALKTPSKLISNLYTKLLVKRLPYKQYLLSLIWEKPRRSFAYVKVPDAAAGHSRPKSVEIGFSASGVLMLASYSTGTLYQYRIPPAGSDERTECTLLLLNTFYGDAQGEGRSAP